MATNGNHSDLIHDLSDEWSEDNVEYEINNDFTLRPIQSTNAFNDITDKGFEFETNEETDGVKDEPDIKDHYWTREEILAHLESNPKPVEDICDDFDVYDERMKCMEEIVANGVYKRVIRQGSGPKIEINSAVLYNLNAYLEGQDEPFDSTWLRGRPNLHKLSYDTVLPGLCAGLLSMRRGERSEFIVRPHLAYLEIGCPPRVPENATILYIVEVMKLFDEGSLEHFETMTFEERSEVDFNHVWDLCDKERVSANSYFVSNRYREAAFRYRRAIRCLEHLTFRQPKDQSGPSDESRAKELLIKLYVNIANTYNKFQKPFPAMSNCKRALAFDPKNAKALYQYGLAKLSNADYDEAERLLKEALALKPNNKEIKTSLQKLDQRMNGDRIVEENLYRKMGSAFNTKH